MRTSIRSFRTLSLTLAFFVTLGIASFASAKPSQSPNQQATEAATATPIDPETVVPLTLGKAFTSPIDADNVTYRYLSFKGKANELVNVTVSVLTGNMSFKFKAFTQGGDEIAYSEGTFVTTNTATIKLPQDGNYKIEVDKADPGSGDFAAGTISVLVNDAPAATPAAAATP
jgi:hypothetical protein